jgi:deoxyribodipyrimidine photo-lyase
VLTKSWKIQMHSKPSINVFWFKRDLRLLDNEGLQHAIESKTPLLLLYIFEPSLKNNPHYHERHWNFIAQSIRDLNKELKPYDTKIYCLNEEVTDVLKRLHERYKINTLFSMQETGLNCTYHRDKEVKKWCALQSIHWVEHVNNGVFRGLTNRVHWRDYWTNYMMQPIKPFSATATNFVREEITYLKQFSLQSKQLDGIQEGGTKKGIAYLESFLKKRHKKYQQSISKPEVARLHCGRISPYLAWGNLSVRYVWQRAKQAKTLGASAFQINAFTSRLRWQAHFIQKFEMETKMEFNSVNAGYHHLKKPLKPIFVDAWKHGKTGYPLVDACMRCVAKTGYLNFRMRAMVVSFFTHHLWQPWQAGVVFLGRQFLDFEPGIHYPQFQMQAGETGINMLRIYNPTKNALEHDADGNFIRKWVPELAQLPTAFVIEPWTMTEIEQHGYDVILGKHYPKPIVDIKKTYKYASTILWQMRRNAIVKKESKRILAKHTLADRENIMDT